MIVEPGLAFAVVIACEEGVAALASRQALNGAGPGGVRHPTRRSVAPAVIPAAAPILVFICSPSPSPQAPSDRPYPSRKRLSRINPPIAWNVYLSGEIHSDWREQIAEGAKEAGLDVAFSSPVTDHGASDDVGVAVLGGGVRGILEGPQGRRGERDPHPDADSPGRRGGGPVRRQVQAVWNAAFDAGFAAALGKPIITLHNPDTTHALKEIDRAAMATAESPEQVVDVLRYVLDDKLPSGA